ncbi:MAG: CoA transferase [Deltaproteobacteria bacterium]|nr:CoA transferase [Deltaproteobacteria bacterium]
MATNQQEHILSGYKVLDFTQHIAGPTATRLLVEMGAEVIKVELAPDGEPSRRAPYMKGRSGTFIQQNRGKKSLCVDVRKPEGLTVLKSLLPKIDVLVENFAPGAIARLGLDYETVKAINPKLVMCSISAFGQQGPLKSKPGYDFIGAAYAGFLDMNGDPNGSPCFPGMAIGDASTGVHAVAAIACALLYRERIGKGQYLDISLVDSYFHYHETSVQAYSLSGGAYQPRRVGSHYPLYAPVGMFKGKSHYLVIMAPTDHQFTAVCRAMSKPELASDPRFATNAERSENRAALINIIEEWIASTPSDEEAMRLLEEQRVPVAPVLSVVEAMNHPHLRERQTVRTVTDRVAGELQIPGFPLRFSEFPQMLELEAAFLGEHNQEILQHYLGYSEERVRELESQGVLRREDF